MNEHLDKKLLEFIETYNKLLSTFDYGAAEFQRDIALGMIFVLVDAQAACWDSLEELKLQLAINAFNSDEMLKNIRDDVSENTAITYDYRFSPVAMKTFAELGYLNLSTLIYIRDRLDDEVHKHRNANSMEAFVYNLQGNSLNCSILNDCIEIMEKRVNRANV
ncbi:MULTISPECIES: hypothetical protein [Pseudoalteromonas]|uniref:hypothetical protein n=1 Tax=Pseudoalteromonas TaxID=53246 RepID=UPI0006B4F31C|nr:MULTISPECIES: hypothetical protein [Pseudoalteromonas]